MWVRDELHVTKIGAKRNIKVNSYGERGTSSTQSEHCQFGNVNVIYDTTTIAA